MTQTATERRSPLLEWICANPYWPLKADVLGQLCQLVERHLDGRRLDTGQIETIVEARGDARGEAGQREYERAGSTAVIPVTGVIAKYSRMVNGSSQPRGTSIETLQAQLAAALDDDRVKSIMLRIESPGGNLAGTADLADAIHAANEQKPVIAFADDMAASGAYWLGAQASRFYANQSAVVGSIGVYTVYVDSSRAYENVGLRVIPVASGGNKATGLPGVSISDEQLAPARKIIDDYFEIFLAAVMRGRGERGLSEEALRGAADGRCFVAADAVGGKLIDGVKTFAQALRSARPTARRAAPTAAAQSAATDGGERIVDQVNEEIDIEEQDMTDKNGQDAHKADATAVEAAAKEATTTERERIAGIEEAFATVGETEGLDAVRRTAIAEGQSVEAAKAAGFDALTIAHAALTGENETLRTSMDRAGVRNALGADASDEQEPEPEGKDKKADGGPATYEAAVEMIRGEHPKWKLSRVNREAATRYPELHEKYKADHTG